MILVGDGCTEQRKNAVPGRLHNVALVAMDRVDHQLERGIDNGTRLFWVELLHQLHRALDVGEESGNRFAFTVADDARRGLVGQEANPGS
jgi:hypothetical protein